MGLACSNIRLLTLTARKADCEYDISINTMRKMALTREMSQLSAEYNSKLRSSQICYYANGSYNKVGYNYLMGSKDMAIMLFAGEDLPALKNDNSMILSDFKGQVILSDEYAGLLIAAGVKIDENGRGGNFSADLIPGIIANMISQPESEADIKMLIEKGEMANSTSFKYDSKKHISGEKGEGGTADTTELSKSMLQRVVDFYYPIFIAASTNGWTTEYNQAIQNNQDYISDALVTGTLQLETINNAGEYDLGNTLTYFTTYKGLDARTTSDRREEVTAWYNAEKERITEEETYLDINIQDLSTELEAIKTEIQAVKSYIDDAISTVFDWGSK